MTNYKIYYTNKKEKTAAYEILEYFGYKKFNDGYAMKKENKYRIIFEKGIKSVPFSNGNAKYINNEKCEFLMFFIPAKFTCPHATPLCRHNCYVDYRYPSSIVGHINAYLWTMRDNFLDEVITKVEKASKKAMKNGKKLVVRIHESGDFYNIEYFAKWVQIANSLIDDKNITFAAYTKSVEYVAAMKNEIPENLVIRFSLWADTKPEQYEIAKNLGLPVYSAVDKSDFEKLPENKKCRCENCGECFKCFENIEKMLLCAIH